MRIFVDSASLAEVEEWNDHPWVSGFTTNPTLMRGLRSNVGVAPLEAKITPPIAPFDPMVWAKELVRITDKPVSIDGPPEVWDLGPKVWRKVVEYGPPKSPPGSLGHRVNLTAVCTPEQVPPPAWIRGDLIISVFAGRIMDTGRDPQPVIDAAKRTGAAVLWASVREPYNIVQAERSGCDIVTVPPATLRKWLEWQGKPLETVAAETIAQFDRDREGLW